MTSPLTLDVIRTALTNRAAAFRRVTCFQPAGGSYSGKFQALHGSARNACDGQQPSTARLFHVCASRRCKDDPSTRVQLIGERQWH
jgi:hypothetical protein